MDNVTLSKFDEALRVVLKHESSQYTDDPEDAGGPTRWGITLNMDGPALHALLGRPATPQDVRNLTEAQAGRIYKERYWDPMRLSEVNSTALCILFFDMCVLIGVYGCTTLLQGCVGANVDGRMGPQTIKAVNQADEHQLCFDFLTKLQDRFVKICVNKPSQIKFLLGWLHRTQDLAASITGLRFVF